MRPPDPALSIEKEDLIVITERLRTICCGGCLDVGDSNNNRLEVFVWTQTAGVE